MDPKDLIVLVTGATSGFGAAIARRFHGAGARVILTGRRQDRLDALQAELGERVHSLCFDVSDRQATTDAIESLPEGFRAIDVLVNNAGLALGLEPAHQASLDDWETMVDTNIKGLLYCTQAVLPGMVARDRGHIVNMSSVAAVYSYPGGNVYGATKAFVSRFSMNLRSDLIGRWIRVTDIEPGLAQTEFSLVRFKGNEAASQSPYQGVDPLTADDIAETVWWAVSLPRHVNINTIEVMATMQAVGPFTIVRQS